MVVGRHFNQKWSQMDVTISQVKRNGQEELYMELFVLPNAAETEARSKDAEILGLQSNGVHNGRFPLSCLSVKPEDARCSSVCGVDPVNNFIQELDSRAT